MEFFNLLVGVMLMMLSFQYGQGWLAIIIGFIMIITIRSLIGIILLLAAMAGLFLLGDTVSFRELTLPIMAVLVIVAIISALREKPAQPSMEDLYAQMGGGMEGGGFG